MLSGKADGTSLEKGLVMNGFVCADVIPTEEGDAERATQLQRHPDLKSLLYSTECAITGFR